MLKLKLKLFITFLLAAGLILELSARENLGIGKTDHPARVNKAASACAPATSRVDLDINNVRTTLMNGGDKWWDLTGGPRYEIPKVPRGSGEISAHSLFAGALWIGGIDDGGQLKLAAQTYRQSGNDFWPGPLSSSGNVTSEVCSEFDRHWAVTREDIQRFLAISREHFDPVSGTYNIPVSQIPTTIREWPGRGNPLAVGARNQPLNLDTEKNLAPFVDVSGDGVYNPQRGDYPDVPGDMAIWWVYNDRGDIHTESGGEAIGLEVRELAFAFATSDEINDMTFYRYDVSNFSTAILDSVYFGQWVDPDLGHPYTDYVGVDAERNLGICYSAVEVDDVYGPNPPLVGVNFFQGPRKETMMYDADSNLVDSFQIMGMSKFLYYNNDWSVIGNPQLASHYYGYLSGTWKNGSPVTHGANGFNTGGPEVDFMFPDDPGSGGWSECDIPNAPGDRRFIQSSGPFTLMPGAQNQVVVGVVWVRPAVQIGCQADFDALRVASDKAQALFDSDFRLLDGPDAPDVTIRELDRQIILTLDVTDTLRNNAMYSYDETDPIIKSIIENLNDPDVTDSTYTFQGFLVYQLRNGQVSPSEFRDPSKARLIAQMDIEDDVDKIINFEFDPYLEADVPRLMVHGNNSGIDNTLLIRDDAFSDGRLVNHKTYYFSVVAYAYNNFIPYDPTEPVSQRRPFLQGRNNVRIYTAIPHKPDPHNQGMKLNTFYGDGPEIMTIEGVGNGARILDLTEESIEEIMANNFIDHPVYQRGMGPVNVKVYDPVRVPNADFELIFEPVGNGITSSTRWLLRNLTTGEEYPSVLTIGDRFEQVIPALGLSIDIRQTANPGMERARNNGFLEGTIEYARPDIRWLSAVPNAEGATPLNWIRSGRRPDGEIYGSHRSLDPSIPIWIDSLNVYANVVGGTWAPFPLVGGLRTPSSDGFASERQHAPARSVTGLVSRVTMDKVASVDIVFTPDRSKWTRALVVEMNNDPGLTQGQRQKLWMRDHPSWTGEVDPVSKMPLYDATDVGRSWFPGYAINVETGERLNIIFSEDSWLKGDNGADMIWNPTSRLFTGVGEVRMGGKHFVYISNTRYDEAKQFQENFLNNTSVSGQNNATRLAFEDVIWVSTAMLANGYELLPVEEGLIPTETKIRLRVGKPYQAKTITGENNGFNKYFFSTDGLAPDMNNLDIASSALDEIRVVPNPYYAFSEYERSPIDNRVKITNLPSKCTVTIYATDGTIMRRFVRDMPADVSLGGEVGRTGFDTSIDWDLTNSKNIPVASGMYLIHINAPGIGERVIKWFGVMRPIELDIF